ncbi:MAG TPA: hypothetical protein PKW33_14290 [Anaerolineaceae bacterium]|nr:hypothetical protein [Anaerolineaceae bacterium]HPN52758.1 hypothetical protein [Anaerolineaceae bacterium]
MKINSNPFALLTAAVLFLLGLSSVAGYRLLPLFTQYPSLSYVVIGVIVLVLLLIFTGKIKENVATVVMVMWLATMVAMTSYNLHFQYDEMLVSAMPFASAIFYIIGI